MSYRKSTPRGQMTKGANTGPAIMLLPPKLRMLFGPNPPLEWIPPTKRRRRQVWTGVGQYLPEFERGDAPKRVVQMTPKQWKQQKQTQRKEADEERLKPLIGAYRKEQKAAPADGTMNCYNTLFVGRLAYEVTERQLLREMEQFGPIQDLHLIKDKENKSRGYAFLEYETEDDMKRAYRSADGMKLEGKAIVVDVERGHTVPKWLPRRLGGGLGGTRRGGKDVNVTAPGRFDPNRPTQPQQAQSHPPQYASSAQGYGGGASYGGGGGYGGGAPRGGYGAYPAQPQGYGSNNSSSLPPPPPRGRYGDDRRGPGYDRKRGRSPEGGDRRGSFRRRY